MIAAATMMMTASIEKNKAFSTLSIVAGGARGSIWNIVDHDSNDECLNKPFYHFIVPFLSLFFFYSFMTDIIDLDDTCNKSPHKKQDISNLEAVLGKLYLEAQPFPEIIDLICHDPSRKVIITGRQKNYIIETETWIRDHLFQRKEYEIHFIGFTNYEAYVASKVSKIVEIMQEINDTIYRVFEDDTNVLDNLEKSIQEMKHQKMISIQFIQVRDGKAWRRKITLKPRP